MMKNMIVSLLVITALFTGCMTASHTQEGNEVQSDVEVYIPIDLDDCFVQLQKLLKPEDVERIRSGTEDDLAQYHFGLGMWMRNNWGLWGGSRLAKWFNAQGIHHPDDMSGIIIDSFWRHLNAKPIQLEVQVKFYQDYWEKQQATLPES